MKKISLLVVIILLFSNISVFAISDMTPTKIEDQLKAVKVISDKFPEAHIETNFIEKISSKQKTFFENGKIYNGKLVGAVEATVYVEEIIENIDGEILITDSRLLNKKEVEELKASNFATSGHDEITYNNLKAYFEVYQTGTAEYKVTLFTRWETIGNNNRGPAWRYDYSSITWGGNFSLRSDFIEVVDNYGSTNSLGAHIDKIDNNIGVIWAFNDLIYLGGGEYIWMNNAEVSARIGKSSLGNNETTITGNYVHTWGTGTGLNISFQGIGISVNDPSDQSWNLVLYVPGIRY